MARATRGPAIYTADDHGAVFTESTFVMMVPLTDIADTHRKWGTPAGGESGMPTKLKPRHVIGKDAGGNSAHIIIPDTTSDIWTGVTTSFAVNGVTYNITGFVGEKRTVLA